MSRVCCLPNISISCVPAFNLDNEQPDYDMDSEDETLLNRLNRKMEIKPLQFEIMVDRLEKASSSQVWREEITERFCFPGGWFLGGCLVLFPANRRSVCVSLQFHRNLVAVSCVNIGNLR